MAHERTSRLGDLQLRILKMLWKAGPSNVAEVHTEVGGDRLAYTTVATMLRKMEDRGLVRHREENRRFIYEAAVQADEVTRSAADDLVDRLFEGSLADAVSHLLQLREISPAELDQLEQMIRQRRQQAE